MADLKAVGFEVSPIIKYVGFVLCRGDRGEPGVGTTNQYSGYNFYQPVPDPEFG